MIRRPPRSTLSSSSAASDVYKRQPVGAPIGGGDLALNHSTNASSVQTGYSASNAVDGNSGTRWGSAESDPQWIYVDLGTTQTINQVKLSWETAYGQSYQIQVSD